jgi:uncharacterized protein (DUF1499 family)
VGNLIDVEIKLENKQGPCAVVEISSKSRIGWYDLGQNKRNIKELKAAIKEHLSDHQMLE